MTERKPEWLKQQSATLEAVTAAKRDNALADLTIEARGLEFWEEIQKEAEVVAKHPPSGLWARFNHSNFAVSRHEDHFRIEAGYLGICPRMSYADCWYRPGDKKIRCKTTLTGSEFLLLLCVLDGQIRAVSPQHAEPMNAEEIVRFLVEPMNDYAIIAALASA
jgi:hypothetical protein